MICCFLNVYHSPFLCFCCFFSHVLVTILLIIDVYTSHNGLGGTRVSQTLVLPSAAGDQIPVPPSVCVAVSYQPVDDNALQRVGRLLGGLGALTKHYERESESESIITVWDPGVSDWGEKGD